MAIKVPSYVSEAAQRGLEWHREGKSGDGVTDKTLAEAREMAAGTVSESKVRRMGPWFRRHRPDMDAPKNKPDNEAFPGAGAVAWALWGGPTSGDLMQTASWAEKTTEQLDRETKPAAASAQSILFMAEDNEISTMPEIIISDIDGTLIDDAGNVIDPVEDFIEAYQSPLVLLTNRAESRRDETVAELNALLIEYTRLIMNGGSQDAPEFKRNEVKALLDQGYDVQAFIDNREDTRKAVAELGVQVIDPAEIINTESNDEDMSKETPEALNAKLTADLSAITSERDTFMAKVTASDAELNAAKELAATLLAERDALALKVSELEAAQATASKQAADLIAKAGAPIAPLNVTPAEQPTKPTGKELLEQLASMSAGKARDEFFIKHKSELFAARKRLG